MLRSAQTRLILAVALLSSLVTVMALSLVFLATDRIIAAETRSVVEAELAGLEDDYLRLGVIGLAAAIDRRVSRADRRDAIYLLADSRGRKIAGNLAAWPATVEPGGGWVELDLIRADTQEKVPVAAASLHLQNRERLLVGRDASGRKNFDRALIRAVGWSLLAALGLSAVMAWLLSRLIFSRLAEISDTARAIVSGGLEQRIPMHGTGDEVDRLAATLNEMLDRIETLIGNLRMTTNSLSHDLRSPLTRLRSHIENLAATDSDPGHRPEAAARAVAEVDHLLRVFSNLTEIARAEARLARDDFDDVDLGELLRDAAELYAPVAEERGIRLGVSGAPLIIRGHRTLLMQAVSNLLENALRHAPDDSEIALETGVQDRQSRLSVSDEGPGIPPEFLDEAILPFKTLDHSRGDGSSGLGLALVAAVARLHGGEIRLQNRDPGLKATMTLSRGPE